ncbi:MAG: MMPL family transporter [Opitutae bacterium]|nr:MMPL family transporter [Opitutae bacterium]
MNFRRRQLLGWSLLGAAALAGGAWLANLDYAKKISSDVLDLIPVDERSPELSLVRQLASQAGARTMFFELTAAGGQPVPAALARDFAARLAQEPAFDQAQALSDPAPREALGRALFAHRLTLLFPRWLHDRETAFAATRGGPADFPRWLADDSAAALGKFLATPEALAFQDLVPADPLLLLPAVVERLKGSLGAGPADDRGPALVWARLAASPLSEAGQGPAFAAIARVTAGLRADFPGLRVADTGVNRFAAASRARIEHEVTWLNALSLAAVLAVAWAFIPAVHRGLHLLPVVLLAVLGAWVGTTLVFERLHILVFVIGSLLTGVAIDYGFYLFMQPPLRPDEDYWAKVRRLAKPLLASCFTTVAGFALLLFSELPLIRQLGVFVGAGLVCALAAAVVYFATVRNAFLPTRSFRGGQALPAAWRRNLRRALLLAWVLALPGLALLRWRDDIRELEIPSPAVQREDARLRALFGEGHDRTVYLTYGASLDAARASLAKLETWLHTAGGGRTETAGLGALVPTAAEHARAVRFWREQPEFGPELRAALARAGFEPGEFAAFFDAYARQARTATAADLADAVTALQAKLSGPLGLLVHRGQPFSWFVTVATRAPALAPPADTHTVSAGQLQSLNQLFSRYRRSALWLSLTGLAIVGAGVFFSYGVRDGVRIFAIPCGACLGLFGLFGWLGQPLNLFHLLGAFLGVCLTHNYSIFSATSAYRHEPPPVSVRLSALTTAASFGVLALSGIPVVRALGTTVALMVVAALLVIEFEHLAGLKGKS